MIFKLLPACQGCVYLDHDNLCAFADKAGVSKAKLGVITGKTGGCAMYKGCRTVKAGMSATDYDDRVQALYDKGKDDAEISAALGYTRWQIWSWRTRHGLPSQGKPGVKPKNKIKS